MNINVSNLDLGYEQCANLNKIAVENGEKILNNLEIIINNLKNDWKGNDATEHINNLIIVYGELGDILLNAKKITKETADKIIAIQNVRNANGGSGFVGSQLSNTTNNNVAVLPKVDITNEYYVDSQASVDYSMLDYAVNEFSTFVNKFKVNKEELLNNWKAGANREEAISSFSKFEQKVDIYNKYLLDAKNNLSIAIKNISKLQ